MSVEGFGLFEKSVPENGDAAPAQTEAERNYWAVYEKLQRAFSNVAEPPSRQELDALMAEYDAASNAWIH